MSLRETWTGIFGPERYIKMWPIGPKADLARQIIAEETGVVPDVIEAKEVVEVKPTLTVPEEPKKVRFFSPKSGGINIVIEPKEWLVTRTPAGDRTIQSPGKSAQFENNIFITDDPVIIEFLTHKYKDRRFPIVREDVTTQSAHRY